MRSDGSFTTVKDLKPQDKVLAIKFMDNGSGIHNVEYEVAHVNIKKTLSQPVYLFMAEHQNMCIPRVLGENEGVEFVCIHQ